VIEWRPVANGKRMVDKRDTIKGRNWQREQACVLRERDR
jgi:tmRNA-binding protein